MNTHRKLSKRLATGVVAAVCGLGAGPLFATLIGDSVDLAILLDSANGNQVIAVAEDVIVVEGAPEAAFGANGELILDVEASSVGLVVGPGLNPDPFQFADAFPDGTPVDFFGILYADLNWVNDPTGEIVGFLPIDTNIIGLDDSRVQFAPNAVAVDLKGLEITVGSYFEVGLLTTHEEVPEPTTVALMALGLLGAFGSARRGRRAAD